MGRQVTARAGCEKDADVFQCDIAMTDAAGGNFHVLVDSGYSSDHRGTDWSPSGRRFAYVDECDDCSDWIVTRRPDGSHAKRLHRSRLRDVFFETPVWSSDARRITYTKWLQSRHRLTWKSDIYAIRRDGPHVTRLTTNTRAKDETSAGRAK